MDIATDLFQIDTKGMCLLCLKDCTNRANPDEDVPKHTNFKIIMQYFKLNVFQLANVSSSLFNSMDGIENRDLMVTLCYSCSMVINQLSELYGQFGRIRLQMDNCVMIVRDLIDAAEGNPDLKEEFVRRIRRKNSAFDWFNGSLAENLRKETKNKCDLKLNTYILKEALKDQNNLKKNQDVEPSHPSPVMSPHQIVTPPRSPPNKKLRTYSTVASREPVASTSTSNMSTSASNIGMEVTIEESVVIDPATFPVETFLLCDDVEDPLTSHSSPTNIIASAVQPVLPAAARPTNASVRKPPGPVPRSPNKTANRTCHTCGKVFKAPQQLRRHIPIHSGLKPHKCEYCGQAFTQACNVRTHAISVHTMQVFRDSLPPNCTEDHLDHAINLVVGGMRRFPNDKKTPCECPYCEKRFRSRFELRTHVLQAHFEVVLAKIKINKNAGLNQRKSALRSSAPATVTTASYSIVDSILPLDEPFIDFVEQGEDIKFQDPLE